MRRKQEKHRLTKSPEYKTWERINRRCYNKADLSYKYYGAKGITVCDRWRYSFNNFYEDMGNKPFPKAQIDREKGEESYNPDNCRWTTQLENIRNRNCVIKNIYRRQNDIIRVHSSSRHLLGRLFMEFSMGCNSNYTF